MAVDGCLRSVTYFSSVHVDVSCAVKTAIAAWDTELQDRNCCVWWEGDRRDICCPKLATAYHRSRSLEA
jgi:hypothetical protein